MSLVSLSHTNPVARKDYRCVACGEPIHKTTKHEYNVVICDGEFQANRWHSECYKFAAENADSPCEYYVTCGDFTYAEAKDFVASQFPKKEADSE